MSDFNEAPKGLGKRAVLDFTNSTYGKLEDIDGTQPYYTYQGIGSLTGGGVNIDVTYNGVNVTYNGDNVTHNV